MSKSEQWRSVAGSPEYLVSDQGRVLSMRPLRGSSAVRELRGWLDKRGYRKVFVYRDDKRVDRYVHHLVAEAFHGPRPEGLDTRHLDGDKTNNAASNLRFGTRSENELDKVRHGTHQNAKKTHCPAGHPYDAVNTYVSPRGERECRACRRIRREDAALRAANVSTERAA